MATTRGQTKTIEFTTGAEGRALDPTTDNAASLILSTVPELFHKTWGVVMLCAPNELVYFSYGYQRLSFGIIN